MLLLVGAARADEEDPIWPNGAGVAIMAFGDNVVDPVDVAGDSLDAYIALEPDMTVYLTAGDPGLCPSEQLSVGCVPAFSADIQNSL
jgi:hypothetical protein